MKYPALILMALTLLACGPSPETVETSEKMIETNDASDAEAILDQYYASAADADFESWISLFAERARFYGTDITEDWPYKEFSAGVKESFDAGHGWDFELVDRRVSLAPDGQTAWFAEVAHFKTTDYTLRPTGVLIKTDDGWKIAQIVMGVPFPNEIYWPFLMALQASKNGDDVEIAAIDKVLTELNEYSTNAQLNEYIALFAENAVFFGTDATERWSVSELRAYAELHFADGRGWTFTAIDRNIILSPMRNTAWFDEVFDHDKYGETRGTGAMIRTNDGWKIAQYNLTFTVPNAVTADVVDIIAAYEQSKE